MAEVFRDAQGVPHVRADDVLDLAAGQGWATARDRSWQLEHLRRRATGTTAEVLGAPQLAWDVFARRVRVVETAQRAFAALDAETQAFVRAYVEGVNAGWDATAPELVDLAIEPQPWEEWTPLAVHHATNVLFAVLPGKLWHHHARAVLGPDEALLSRDPAYAAGSNAWAVGGARTASGWPLVGGDPHRAFESPGVYAQVRLAVPHEGVDVAGFAFVGVPGVQHFAQAEEVAWAITNAQADYQDVYEESLDDVVRAHEETVLVRGGDPVTVEVLETPRGPLFEVGRAAGRGLALRGASWVLGDLGFGALLPLLRARSVADVDAALDAWVEPVNNVVVADRAGRVRFRCAGRVPERPDAHRRGVVASDDPAGGWTGWVDLPGHDVAADGQVVTANERRGSESDRLGTEFAPPDRARRLDALLTGRDDLTAADFTAFHDDALVTSPLVDLAAAGEGPVAAAVAAWDRRMRHDSTGAAAYAAWRDALARRLTAEPVFDPLRDAHRHGPLFAASLDPGAWVGLALERLAAAGAPYDVDLAALSAQALRDAEGHPPTWGETHVFQPFHAFDGADPALGLRAPEVPVVGVSGDTDTVRCTGWLPGLTQAAFRGSVARYVWDLGDRRRSGWVVPTGASGDPRSPHHLDQLAAWCEGRLLPVELDWDALASEGGTPRGRA